MLPELTDEQRSAIDCKGNRVIIAAPGSGKTLVALAKAVQTALGLLETESKVLVITYTKHAHVEFQARVEQFAGSDLGSYIQAATIHGWVMNAVVRPFARYLASGGVRLALAGSAAHIEAIQEAAAINRCTPAFVEATMSYVYRLSDGSAANASGLLDPAGQAIARSFWDSLYEKGYVDYSNTLYVGYQILEQLPWVTHGLAKRYPLIIVDEYQDCSAAQLAILKKLHEAGSKLFLVGDYFQCVYSFAGADHDELLNFVRFIGADEKTLSGSHRCSRVITDKAKRIFQAEIEPIGDALKRCGSFTSREGDSERFLVDFVSDQINAGISPDDIAFVSAQNWRIDQHISLLRLAGIAAAPGRTKRRDPEWRESYIESVFAADPPTIIEDFEDLVDETLGVIERLLPLEAKIDIRRTDLRDALMVDVLHGPELKGNSIRNNLSTLSQRLERALKRSYALNNSHLQTVIDRFGPTFGEENREYSKFLNQTVDTLRKSLQTKGCVRGYTFHGIKGLEFEAVALMDIGPPYVPHENETDELQTRRLLYVGVTRTKSRLLVHAPIGRRSSFANLLL